MPSLYFLPTAPSWVRIGRFSFAGLVAFATTTLLSKEGLQSAHFDQHLVAGNYYYSYGLAVADLDGDGDLDFTSADTRGEPGPAASDPRGDGAGNMYWFENDGKGNFQRHIIQRAEAGYLERHAIGDINGDGFPDVVVVKNRDGHIVWFENSGHPAADTRWKRHVVTTDFLRAYDIALLDVDGDGRLDIAASAYRGNVLAWFRNPEPAALDQEWKKEIIDSDLKESRTVRLGDFNGDGKKDILATGFAGAMTAWYEQTGSPDHPWQRHVIDDHSPQPCHGCADDIDGDGDADVVMALGMRGLDGAPNIPLHEVVWYENVGHSGNGDHWKKHLIDRLPYAFEAIAADVNGDGRIDVVATSYVGKNSQLILYENTGDPKSRWGKRVLKSDWHYANQPIVADLNGDKRPDILAESCANRRDVMWSEVCWWENTGSEVRSPVATAPATLVGPNRFTMNGRIQPHGLPTKYWFEYGADSTYGKSTPAQPLPPKLSAHLRETWDRDQSQWWGGMGGRLNHVSDGKGGGYLRYSLGRPPAGDPDLPYDPNHMDGIGALHLTAIVYPALMESEGHKSLALGGGKADLRGARVNLKLRGDNFAAKGAELVWWTQSDIDLALQDTDRWQRANWAYTGATLTDALISGKWEQANLELKNDSRLWTYAGNNVTQKRPTRYAYDSIDKAQANLNADFIVLLAFVNPDDPPTGNIELDDFDLAYRNHSLLSPANGGMLIHAPLNGEADPSTLTDGWRNGAGHTWQSAAAPSSPIEFGYRFALPVTIMGFQLHQSPDWPAKDVELLASPDGKAWIELWRGQLESAAPEGPNFSFVNKRGFNQPAQYLKVRVLSGYRAEHWGLGEIEVFGTRAALGTDDAWYAVNLDTAELTPGKAWHYRLVAENGSGKYFGEDQTCTIPDSGKPQVLTGDVRRVTAQHVLLTGRLTPMGKPAHYYFEYGPTEKYGTKTPEAYGGRQQLPRLVLGQLSDLAPDTTYHYRLVARNDAGVEAGADCTFHTSAK